MIPENNQNESKKQVDVINEDSSVIEEITGGMRNALEKGGDFNKIKQSFLNSGYASNEVEAAARAVSNNQPQQGIQQQGIQQQGIQQQGIQQQGIQQQGIQQQGIQQQGIQQQTIGQSNFTVNQSSPKFKNKFLQNQKALPLVGKKQKKVPKGVIIFLIIFGIIILTLAGFLAVYWEKLMGPF